MNCPNCNKGSIQTSTVTHRDELGIVQEPFCFCLKCNKDITERVVDEWVIRYSEVPNKTSQKRNRNI